MAKAKQESEAFEVPDPSAVSDQVNAALAEKGKLDNQHKELKEREAHLAEQLRGYMHGSVKLKGSAREQAHALGNLRQQLAEVRHEITIVGRAREEARLAYQTAIGKASREVCDATRTEWNKRIRACALSLFQFAEAHVRLMELKQQLHDREVRWLSFLVNTQFNGVIDSLHHDDLSELLANELITREEVPQVLRDRFNL